MLSVEPTFLAFRVGDLLPALRFRVTPAPWCCVFDHDREQPIDPSLYTGWTLHLVGLVSVDVALTWDASQQLLTGSFSSGDTDVAGRYLGTLVATEIASGKARTFPTVGDLVVEIEPLPS